MKVNSKKIIIPVLTMMLCFNTLVLPTTSDAAVLSTQHQKIISTAYAYETEYDKAHKEVEKPGTKALETLLSTMPDLRKQIENEFGIESYAKKVGYRYANIVEYHRNEINNWRPRLKEMACNSFADIDGSADESWYRDTLALGVYSGIINGKVDNNKYNGKPYFDANAVVSRVEAMTMYNRAVLGIERAANGKVLDKYKDKWYAPYISNNDASNTYVWGNSLESTQELEKGMTRIEAITLIMQSMYSLEVDTNNLYDTNKLASEYYPDVIVDKSIYQKDGEMASTYFNRLKASGKVDKYGNAALIAAYEMGVIQGDENGNANPYKTVTRAEFIKMLENASLNWYKAKR